MKPRRRADELPVGQHQQAAVDHEHDRAQAQQPADEPAVDGGHPVEDAVEAAEEPAQHGVDRPDDEPADQAADERAGRESSQRSIAQDSQLGMSRRRGRRAAGRPNCPARRSCRQARRVSKPPTMPKIHQGSASCGALCPCSPSSVLKISDGPRRRHRHGVDRRDDRRDGDRHGELAEELAA